jgi:oligopeptidase B
VYALAPSANPEFETTTVRYTYTSLVTPQSVFDLDMTTNESTLLKQQPVLGDFDPDAYETGRLWAKAPDGTAVPISWVARKGLARDGSNPAVLYGYGSYESSVDPAFSSLRLSLLDRGFVWAIAHIRGGGEMGRLWYENGRMANKQNTFDDFIACTEQFIADGFTSPERLVIWGGSAGGLLVGAVLNDRPELYTAAVAQVPFVDCLTSMLDPSLPLTAGEWEEWGNPIESAEVYEWMKAYSPYDNVRKANYPAMFVTTGYNDPRVAYWEPAKWVQRLREASTSGKPIYLKIDIGAGHQGPSGRYDAWKDVALEYAFVLDALGIAEG